MNGGIKKVIIIDYHLGNLFSVKQACDKVGMNAAISDKCDEITAADALVLPGVGAFNEAMNNLNNLGIKEIIKQKVALGTPLFGVCLGQQLLFTESEEFGATKGLDIISGVIKRFPEMHLGEKIRVPHIAWNTIETAEQDWKSSPLNGLDESEYMYFVHSYYVVPSEKEVVLSCTDYDGIQFCSSVQKDNIFASQFHPEKSGEKGISVYKNWAEINNLLIK
jgi:glutamine amidotransferase